MGTVVTLVGLAIVAALGFWAIGRAREDARKRDFENREARYLEGIKRSLNDALGPEQILYLERQLDSAFDARRHNYAITPASICFLSGGGWTCTKFASIRKWNMNTTRLDGGDTFYQIELHVGDMGRPIVRFYVESFEAARDCLDRIAIGVAAQRSTE